MRIYVKPGSHCLTKFVTCGYLPRRGNGALVQLLVICLLCSLCSWERASQFCVSKCPTRCDYIGKAIPLQAWSGPEGSRKLKFPDYMTTVQDGGKVVRLTHRPPLPPGNAPGTHFC